MKRNFLLTSFLALLTLVSFGGTKSNAVWVALATPGTPTAINTYQQSIRVSWTYNGLPAAGGFVVQAYDGVTPLTPVTVSDTTARTVTLSQTGTPALTPGKTYTFTVTAKAALPADDSSPSAASAGLLYFAGLKSGILFGFTDNIHTYNTIGLQWHDNADNVGHTQGYEVKVSSPGNPSFTVDAFPKTGTYYEEQISGLKPKTYYEFQIKPFRMVGSTRVYGTETAPIGRSTKVAPPAIPTVYFTNNCPTFVGVNWTVDRPEDVQSFLIQRSFNGSNYDVISIKTTGENSYYDLDARQGRTIWYRVIAINESLPYGISVGVPITVTPYSGPPAPANVASDKSLRTTTSLTVKWNNLPYDTGCKSNVRESNYVEYKLASEPESEYKRYAILTSEANTIKLEGFKPKDVVDFRIFAVSDQGILSERVYGRDTTLGPPYAPSNLTIETIVDPLDNTTNILSWSDNARDEDGFTVEVSKDNTTFAELGNRTFNLEFNFVKYTHIPVEEGLVYYYRVKAFNTFGISDYSPVVSQLVPYSVAPKAPYALKAVLSSGKVVLTWRDDSYREENFVVEKSSDNGATYATIANLGRNVVTFTDENISAATAYKYRVKAVNPKGSSEYASVDYKPGVAGASSLVLNTDAISVYPNPTTDFVNVKIPTELVGKSGNITITDKNSRVVLNKVFKFDSEELNLDFNKFGEGMYNVTISTGDSKVSRKVYKF